MPNTSTTMMTMTTMMMNMNTNIITIITTTMMKTMTMMTTMNTSIITIIITTMNTVTIITITTIITTASTMPTKCSPAGDEVFTSWGETTAARFTVSEIEEKLKALDDTWTYGFVLRAKGIVQDKEDGWIHFDYTPGEINVRKGPAAATGMLCVIGAQMKEDEVKHLFGVA